MRAQYSLKQFTAYFFQYLFLNGLLCIIFFNPAFGSEGWQQIETRYTIVRYQTLEDLKRFDQEINYGKTAWGISRVFGRSSEEDIPFNVTNKVDALWERVREILDMRKQSPKVTINIYGSKQQLGDAYTGIYNEAPRFRAWYIYEYNTIYLNVDDVNDGMLAHEMAHSIIDHYLQIRPPAASAEILARYVDSHLRE